MRPTLHCKCELLASMLRKTIIVEGLASMVSTIHIYIDEYLESEGHPWYCQTYSRNPCIKVHKIGHWTLHSLNLTLPKRNTRLPGSGSECFQRRAASAQCRWEPGQTVLIEMGQGNLCWEGPGNGAGPGLQSTQSYKCKSFLISTWKGNINIKLLYVDNLLNMWFFLQFMRRKAHPIHIEAWALGALRQRSLQTSVGKVMGPSIAALCHTSALDSIDGCHHSPCCYMYVNPAQSLNAAQQRCEHGHSNGGSSLITQWSVYVWSGWGPKILFINVYTWCFCFHAVPTPAAAS